MADPDYALSAPDSFAAKARTAVEDRRSEARAATASLAATHPQGTTSVAAGEDLAGDDSAIAIVHLRDKSEFHKMIDTSRGIKWGRVAYMLAEKAPAHAQRDGSAFAWGNNLVKQALDQLYPDQWVSVAREDERNRGKFPKFIMLKKHQPKAEPEANQDGDENQIGALFETVETGEQPPF